MVPLNILYLVVFYLLNALSNLWTSFIYKIYILTFKAMKDLSDFGQCVFLSLDYP